MRLTALGDLQRLLRHRRIYHANNIMIADRHPETFRGDRRADVAAIATLDELLASMSSISRQTASEYADLWSKSRELLEAVQAQLVHPYPDSGETAEAFLVKVCQIAAAFPDRRAVNVSRSNRER